MSWHSGPQVLEGILVLWSLEKSWKRKGENVWAFWYSGPRRKVRKEKYCPLSVHCRNYSTFSMFP